MGRTVSLRHVFRTSILCASISSLMRIGFFEYTFGPASHRFQGARVRDAACFNPSFRAHLALWFFFCYLFSFVRESRALQFGTDKISRDTPQPSKRRQKQIFSPAHRHRSGSHPLFPRHRYLHLRPFVTPIPPDFAV